MIIMIFIQILKINFLLPPNTTLNITIIIIRTLLLKSQLNNKTNFNFKNSKKFYFQKYFYNFYNKKNHNYHYYNSLQLYIHSLAPSNID